MNYLVSIVLPSIRDYKLDKVYWSLKQSCTQENFELIIVGPTPPKDSLLTNLNIKYIKDFGSPVRASQIGALLASGKYITFGADDATYIDGAFDKVLNHLESYKYKDYTHNIVVTNYTEGGNLLSNDVLRLNIAYPKVLLIPDNWYIFNSAFLHTSFFKQMGGYDCIFETCPIAHADLAARCQRAGAKVDLLNIPISHCEHMPGTSGDHAPIHWGQLLHDEPLYKEIYNKEENIHRTVIDFDNWKGSPEKWARRFGH